MLRLIILTTAILFSLGAANTASAQFWKKKKTEEKKEVQFLDIEVTVTDAQPQYTTVKSRGPKANNAEPVYASNVSEKSSAVEKATSLQFKYALLLNAEVELISNLPLFSLIDDWFGTRYRYGGESKNGIDCSAFMQVMYAGIFGLTLPRTAREQYKVVRKVNRSFLKEGDLIFFNTTGGISHVGFYLMNNKFVHASSSEGVTISDLDDPYWSRKIVSAGRYEHSLASATPPQP